MRPASPTFSSLLFAAVLFVGCRETPPAAPSVETRPETPQPLVPPAPATRTVRVFFVDDARFAAGTEPYEVAVDRTIAADADPAREILRLYFVGPTAGESARGLRALTNGLTGVRELRREGTTLHVFTTGACATNGAAYNVSTLIRKNLRQVPGVEHVKLYDPDGRTQAPQGAGDSIPECMEP